MVIFDEAHRCKNHKSITSKLLVSIFKCNCKVLLLSATISDKIPCFKPFGVVFGFYNELKEFTIWLRKNIKDKTAEYKNKNMTKDQMTLDIIHNKMFPAYGSRMKIKELGSMFPSNQVLSQSYMCENQEEIQAQYKIIKEAFEDLKSKETRSEGLGKLIRARMKVEMLKVPIILDIIEEALDSNYSVVCFCNYKDTMYKIAEIFETKCLIHGDQTMEERQNSIDQFQSNKSRIIIAIIQAGGVGISLHDIHGGHPRMSVINPTWSGQDMQQALGRIHRAGAQTPAMQRIVFCAGTYEEKICEMIKGKLTNISAINDGDLIGPQFTDEEYTEVSKSLDKLNLMDESKNKAKIVKNKHHNSDSDDSANDNTEDSDNNTDDNTEEVESDIKTDDLSDDEPIKTLKVAKEKKKFSKIVSVREKKHFVKKIVKDGSD
jgi:SNF2 family DNA or RNA helicase